MPICSGWCMVVLICDGCGTRASQSTCGACISLWTRYKMLEDPPQPSCASNAASSAPGNAMSYGRRIHRPVGSHVDVFAPVKTSAVQPPPTSHHYCNSPGVCSKP